MQKYILLLVYLLSTSAPAYALIEITGIKGAILDTGSPTLGGGVSCVGSIDLTAEGNAGPFTFQWSNGAETEDINELCPGGYSVTVTNRFGCSFVRQAIVPLCIRTLSDTEITESSIIQQSSLPPYKGGVDITVNTPATAPLYYKWIRQSDGIVVGTTEDLLNVDPGTYCVEVSSPCGNTVSECYTIQGCAYAGPGGAFQLSYAMTQPCPNSSNGSIQVIVGGSVQGPFGYLWSNGSTTQTINTLSSGSFTIRITDPNGCKYSERVDLKPVIGQVSLQAHHAGCGNQGANGGSIKAQVVPAGNYTYLWSTGQTTQTITGLAAGNNYCVTVTDPVSGCTTTKCQAISQGLPLASVMIESKRNDDCDGGSCYGSVTINVNEVVAYGAADPYNAYIYEWGSLSSSTTTTTTSASIQNLCEGNYNVTVSDLKQCTVVKSFCIGCCHGNASNEPSDICGEDNSDIESAGNVRITPPSIANGYKGSIALLSYTTQPNTLFYWTKKGDPAFEAFTHTITNLSAGTYCVGIQNGCNRFNACFELINDLHSPTVVPSCIGGSSGQIKISFIKEMARPIRVDWANGSAAGLTTPGYTIRDLAPRNYTVTITDGNNLQTTFTKEIIKNDENPESYNWPLSEFVNRKFSPYYDFTSFEGKCDKDIFQPLDRRVRFYRNEVDNVPLVIAGDATLGIDWNGEHYSTVNIDPDGNISVIGPSAYDAYAGQTVEVALFDNSGCRVEECWVFPEETSGIVGGVIENVTLPGTSGVTVNAYTQCTTCDQECAKRCGTYTPCEGDLESNRFTYIPANPARPCDGGTFYFSCDGTDYSSIILTTKAQGQEFIDFSTFESIGEGICRYPAGCLFEVTNFMPAGYFNPDIPVYVNTDADLPSTACNVPPVTTGGGGTDVPCDGLKEIELTDAESCTGVVICIGLGGFSVTTDFQFKKTLCRSPATNGPCIIVTHCVVEDKLIFSSTREPVGDECETLPECPMTRPAADRSSEETDTKLVKKDDFEFFPNPFNQRLLLRYEAAEAGNLTLQLYDIAGHVFFTQVLTATAGSNFFQIETDKNMPEGFYFVTLQSPNKQVVTRKIIKMGN